MAKDWNRHVAHTDALSQTRAFRELRDLILDQAMPNANDRALDVGTGTGLLALPLAERTAQVWAIDISVAMVDALRSRAHAAGLENIKPVVCSATSLPLEDGSVDLAVSNYCFHHLGAVDKREALGELYRVLAPGGRLVFGDMMFELALGTPRDRAIIKTKVRALLGKGPAGLLRLTRSIVRVLAGTGEQPASPQWWREALGRAGFVEISVDALGHEGGVAAARKPGLL